LLCKRGYLLWSLLCYGL
nr:immunoglobulin heavy chain junction region [Mus musculus]